MDNSTDLNKWLMDAGKDAKWGIRVLYLLSFAFYSYFMYFDTLFVGSRIPFILSFVAVWLVVPVVIFPTEWMLRFRIGRLAKTHVLGVDSIPHGNKLAVTSDGNLLIFHTNSKWKVQDANAFFATGTVEKTEASIEALAIHKENQEHIIWSSVVLEEVKRLNIWFIIGNALLYTLPSVREFPGVVSPADIWGALIMSTLILLFSLTVRDRLTRKIFLGNKRSVVTSQNTEGHPPQYALFDTHKTGAVLANVHAGGKTFALEAVTLNGGLLYAVMKDDVLVHHMIIEKE